MENPMKLPTSQLELLSQQEVEQLDAIGESIVVESFSGVTGKLSLHKATIDASNERARLAAISVRSFLALTISSTSPSGTKK